MLKTLKEARRLASSVTTDMSNVLEYGSMVKTEEEAEVLALVQVKLQAILRNVDEALEADNDTLTELDHGHRALTAVGVSLSDDFGILSLAERIEVLHSKLTAAALALERRENE